MFSLDTSIDISNAGLEHEATSMDAIITRTTILLLFTLLSIFSPTFNLNQYQFDYYTFEPGDPIDLKTAKDAVARRSKDVIYI
jgi:hypothetical protein